MGSASSSSASPAAFRAGEKRALRDTLHACVPVSPDTLIYSPGCSTFKWENCQGNESASRVRQEKPFIAGRLEVFNFFVIYYSGNACLKEKK